MFVFFDSLRSVLPCPMCRQHYAKHLQKLPIQVQSREDLMMWLFELHNLVNRELGHPQVSKQDFLENGESVYLRGQTKKTSLTKKCTSGCRV